jgi:hypothetical protein
MRVLVRIFLELSNKTNNAITLLTFCSILVAELELQKLQRQYRLMEGDRKAYGEESKSLITKQR